MLIEPNTYIRLIKNCPLDKKYEHTFYFNNVDEQAAHFMSMPGVPFSKQSYQRYSKGVLTVQGTMAQLYNCNYMMFKNESFENKWFYAFVKRVEYVNNITCRVYYEIDVMQTWFFDYQLKECLVVREHSVTDVPGDNLVCENIRTSDYVYDWADYNYPHIISIDNDTGELIHGVGMDKLSLVIMYDPSLIDLTDTLKLDEYIRDESYYGGVYQGTKFLCIPLEELYSVPELTDILLKFFDAVTDEIIACFCMPSMFIPAKDSKNLDYYYKHPFYIDRNKTFGNYTPKNNKLLTYPYTCAYLTSNRGAGNEFAFEQFDTTKSGRAIFYAVGSFGATPSAMAYPANYLGCKDYFEGAVNLGQFPVCTWCSSDLIEWLNTALFTTLKTVGIAYTDASEATDARVMRELRNPYSSFTLPDAPNGPPSMEDVKAHYINTRVDDALYQHIINGGLTQRKPSIVHGSGDTNLLIGCEGGRNIYALVKRIREQDAVIIDQYFTMYGYATNRVKVPNIKARPFWSYVKTSGCKISGAETNTGVTSIPSDDADKIKGIYDSGITFWNSFCEIGEYSLYDNSPY